MKDNSSRAIVFTNSEDSIASKNTIIGFDIGIEAINSPRTTASENTIISPEVLEIFQNIENAIKTLKLDETNLSKYEKSLSDLKNSAGTPLFKDRYNSFISTAADHISILLPVITPLAGYI